ncbi:MAG: TIGR02099 family protein, partial [Methylophaga sp.]|nr:TIGR02099 family protein [Methylophaga sp.]
RQSNSWQLAGRNIQLYMNDDEWPETGFTINKNEDGTWLIASNYIRLSDITSLASLSEDSPEVLRKQRPAGDVERFNLRYSADEGVKALAFSVRDGAVESWNGYPGLTGLTMSLNWNEGLAKVKLESHKLTLHANKWLDHAVFFDSVTGTLNLQKSDKTWLVKTDEFRVWNDDLTLQLDGQVEQRADGEIVNNIKLKLEDIVVEHWQNYMPQNVLNTSFETWSGKAFKAGKIVDGDIEWTGKLLAFPYNGEEEGGFFKMALNVENIQLHYAEGWPELFGVTGTITSHGHDLTIKSKQGKVAGFDFEDVTTVINNLNEKKPILIVNGKLNGSSKQAVSFIQNSPLNERFGSALKSITMIGKSDIGLELTVPLTNVVATEVKGHVSFIDSQLHHNEVADVGLLNVNGLLRFDNNGVYADSIKARLFDEAVEITVQPKGKRTGISMVGQLSTDKLTSLWPNDVPQFIQGKTRYQLDITVLEKAVGDFYLDYLVSTDLKGIEVNIPHPFIKAKEDKKELKVSMDNIDNEFVYFFKYGDEVNATAVKQNDGWRAAIKFGEEQEVLPKNGIKIRGKLTELSIDDWLDWSEKQAKTKSSPLLSSIDDVSMSIDTLTGFEQKLTSLNYSINKDGQGWRINLKSKQTDKGSIYWPANFTGPAPLEITLDKLALVSSEGKQDKEAKPPLKMTLWPAMDINIEALTFDNMNLGKLEFHAKRQNQTWKIDSALLTSNLLTAEIVKGSSQWQQSSSLDQSKLAVKMTSNNLTALLDGLGYQQAIESEHAQLIFDLSWPDTPLELTRENVTGHLNITMGKGKLNDVEPGAAGRVFGLMSIAALPRRLALDFSDLFSAGFTFDSIKGDFELANGLALTDNLTLNGASAKIEMSGSTDLINKHYDQQVKITPNVSSTLPLAGAVAGGPVGLGVGAALLVVDKLAGKLFGKNIVNLISYKYHLTGPWDEPQMSVIKPVTP